MDVIFDTDLEPIRDGIVEPLFHIDDDIRYELRENKIGLRSYGQVHRGIQIAFTMKFIKKKGKEEPQLLDVNTFQKKDSIAFISYEKTVKGVVTDIKDGNVYIDKKPYDLDHGLIRRHDVDLFAEENIAYLKALYEQYPVKLDKFISVAIDKNTIQSTLVLWLFEKGAIASTEQWNHFFCQYDVFRNTCIVERIKKCYFPNALMAKAVPLLTIPGIDLYLLLEILQYVYFNLDLYKDGLGPCKLLTKAVQARKQEYNPPVITCFEGTRASLSNKVLPYNYELVLTPEDKKERLPLKGIIL
jgi:hypothetical protein